MRSKIALAVFSVLATISLANTEEIQDNDYPEVSRLGRNVLTLT